MDLIFDVVEYNFLNSILGIDRQQIRHLLVEVEFEQQRWI